MSEFFDMHAHMERQLESVALVGLFKHHHETASRLQQQQRNIHLEARQPMRESNYVVDVLRAEKNHVPGPHRRLLFGPQTNQPTRHGVGWIVVRYPYSSAAAISREEPENRWNDCFVEIIGTNGESQDYLCNSKGLVPYDNLRHLGLNPTSDIDSDLFTTEPVLHPKVSITPVQLQDLIGRDTIHDDAYAYHHQVV